MTTALARRTETSYSVMPLPGRVKYAETLAAAGDMIPGGLFDKQTGRPSPAKIFLAFETGAMLGLDPMASLQGIDVIEGRATIAPRLMLALIRQAGYRVKITESGTVEGGDYAVTTRAYRPEDPDDSEEATFSIRQAARAGLCKYDVDPATGDWKVTALSGRGNPLPWQMYPEDLTQWRSVSRLGRKGFGHILLGIAYTPEELEAVVGEDGTRDFTVQDETEARLITELLGLDDKQDLRAFYQRVTDAQDWTPKLSAEFDVHLMRTTKDSAPKAVGAPGNTGDPDLDGEQQEPARHDEDGDLQGTEPAEPEPVPVAATAAAPRAFDASAMSTPAEPEIDPEIADYERALAAGEITEP
jgi:hypothetical protein